MLKVDLRQLERRGRLSIEDDVPPDAPLWHDLGLRFRAPLQVRLEAQYAGRDVVVRGTLEGSAELPCSRCLKVVFVPVDEEVAFLFRPGISEVEAEDAEIYVLPERGDELDLSGVVREQVTLSVPQYAVCEEACRGLCPKCGANLNLEQCRCEETVSDDRWAALRKLRSE